MNDKELNKGPLDKEQNAPSISEDESTSSDNLIQQRRVQLETLRDSGWNYPNDFNVKHTASYLHDTFATATKEDLEEKASDLKDYSLAGRLVLKRDMGKTLFLTLQDSSGRIQVYVRKDLVGDDEFEKVKNWQLGDIVGVKGGIFRTKTQELSIKAEDGVLLTKSLRPLPEKYHGLSDTEQRYRKRYLDLLLNPKSAKIFKFRSAFIMSIRQFFTDKNFLEVETPMMHTIAGGANAKPFETFHNALDLKMFLRIAPELFLKRLLVGGFNKVFEINRNFRNEGLSTKHMPEFTMLEFYEAFADVSDFMDILEELFHSLATQYCEKGQVVLNDQSISLTEKFTRISHKQAVLDHNPQLDATTYDDLSKLIDYAKSLEIKPEASWRLGKLQNEVFEKTVESKLIQPTYITDYPAEVSPLARRNDKDPSIADRFELFIGGAELANGFSELNDPDEQARIFKAQVAAKDDGDEEAMNYDEDYITALEHGMPPAAGAGLGIDRLVMLFTSSSNIRDVVLFPTLRPSNR
ncbi:MAG: lysine--tRNA ligase [Candidatus Portiera sp.]|nr:lysine--tRNA ligase [Portiera sp.]